MKRLGVICLAVCFLAVSMYVFAVNTGEEIPNFPLYKTTGERIVFEDIRSALASDEILIINFTSVHCVPCKKEIPELADLAKTMPKVKVIFIYAERGAAVKAHAASFGIADRAYCDDPLNTIFSKFGVKATPMTMIVSANGVVLEQYNGYAEKNLASMKNIISRERSK